MKKAPRWPNNADLNVRLLRSLATYLNDTHGREELIRVAASVGLAPDDFDGRVKWVSIEQFEAFLTAARESLSGDDEFRAALVHRNAELSFGPLRFVLWATSPRRIYELGCHSVRVVSSISKFEVTSAGRNFISVRYTSQRKESRENCMMRQQSGRALPTLWGLPAAELIEGGCIARGDDACEYTFRWHDRRQLAPRVLGFSAGVTAAVAAHYFGHANLVVDAALPLFGGALGWAWDTRERIHAAEHVSEEMREALRAVAAEDADSRHELLEYARRQREWTQLMEQQLAERTAAAEQASRQIEAMLESRVARLRGISHDLHSPMNVIRGNIEYLRGAIADRDLDAEACGVALEDQHEAVDKIATLLGSLMEMIRGGKLIELKPQRLEVGKITDRLRRTLAALVFGRNIKASVFATREAPEWISCDELLFDRVADNLLANAAKYTDRGSILVELSGKPGFLTLKVLDTGRGIAAEEIEHIFEPGGSAEEARASGSYGLGLSVVVQLLHQIGGSMEVMSKPGRGTTFWVHFPREIHEATKDDRPTPPVSSAELVRRVVTIRAANDGRGD